MSGAGDGVLVVNYHYCQPPDNGVFSGMTSVRPDKFAAQVDSMRARFRPLRASDLPAAESGFLITFDDGTRDVFEHALPILKAAAVPAVIYCCSQPVLEGRVLDVQKVHMLQSRLGRERFRRAFLDLLAELPNGGERDDPSALGLDYMYRYDDPETRRFKFLLNVELPYHLLSSVLERMFAEEFGDEREIVRHVYMSEDDIRRAADMGFEIGVHTHAHRLLSRLDAGAQRAEIETPLNLFQDLLGERTFTMSYPYGIRGSFNATTKSVLTDLGIGVAFSLGRRIHRLDQQCDLLEIPRFDVNDVFDAQGELIVPEAA
ncbi:polysaccharide deacetylase family protein [Pelagibius sp. 7325]|uniref:polysaccharide deacetylase family protein n=1 Tax=Pelagibius sp. 7325 TaxID=3131994 RepID=UPI0030EB42E7